MRSSEVPDVEQMRFRDAMARWASGVTVVAANGPNGPAGLTVSAFSSLSLEPPLILACIGASSGAHDPLCAAEGFSVHILDAGQADLSVRFATTGIDRFAGLDHEIGAFGAPLLPLGLARMVCARHATLPGGDHTILVGRVVEVELADAEPLLHYSRSYGRFSPA
jgi:flavin reductase (DIM6/NTAB) family NADH-FMN oxidoreductase RutF